MIVVKHHNNTLHVGVEIFSVIYNFNPSAWNKFRARNSIITSLELSTRSVNFIEVLVLMRIYTSFKYQLVGA